MLKILIFSLIVVLGLSSCQTTTYVSIPVVSTPVVPMYYPNNHYEYGYRSRYVGHDHIGHRHGYRHYRSYRRVDRRHRTWRLK